MINKNFQYSTGSLYCEKIELTSLARKHGTPLYIYSNASIRDNFLTLKQSLPKNCHIHYAVKANSNISILKKLAVLGCGADIVSGGELFRCLKAGIKPSNIVFSGVGKTSNEIKMAISAGIDFFNVESLTELSLINELSRNAQKTSRVSLRVNPDINAKTHPHISTGLKNNKFGLSSSELRQAQTLISKSRNVVQTGLSCHIGSQITDLRPLVSAWKELILIAEKSPTPIVDLDLGGGLGISYSELKNDRSVSLKEYALAIRQVFSKLKFNLHIEPGRSLVGNSGVLLTRVVQTKQRGKKHWYIVDSGMNDLIRPALYNARHAILPVIKNNTKKVPSTIAGPVCESSDVFINEEPHPQYESGDLLCIMDAGAYGMSMSSQYNSRPKPAEILVMGANSKLITKRESYNDLIKNEIF